MNQLRMLVELKLILMLLMQQIICEECGDIDEIIYLQFLGVF